MRYDGSTLRTFTRSPRLRSYALTGLLMAGSFAGLAVATFPATPGPSVYMVKEINPNGHGWPMGIMVLDGFFVFNADDGVHGQELWRSDGSYEGTYMVKDIVPGWDGSTPMMNKRLGDRAFFLPEDNEHGFEYWLTDGTEAGTYFLKDIDPSTMGNAPGDCGSIFRNGATSSGLLYFRVDDGIHGIEPWISDGTPQGTYLLKDIVEGSVGSNVLQFAEVGGTMFFSAGGAGPIPGFDLWKSDGTEEGTVPLKDLFGLLWITDVGGIALFEADDGINGRELWKSDGTPEGTVMVKDIAEGSGWSSPGHLTNVDGTLYFRAATSTWGTELWKSDGTEEGTVLVKDINPGPGSSELRWFTNVDGTLFFVADDGEHGWEVWKSDGTEAGTVMVADINPSAGRDFEPYSLAAFGKNLCFSADDGTSGTELWITDGTEAGTIMLADINPGGEGSWPGTKTVFDGVLYFVANDGTRGLELWAYDPTPADIPAVSVWGLSVMVLALLTLGSVMARQRRERTWV